MCAATAAARGRRVVVLEHGDQAGRKIAISGGGRCNFTNLHTTPDNFLSGNPHFCRSALARYTPSDFIALVERYGIRWHEKHSGQLFCDGSARQIVAMLLEECERGGADVVLGCSVARVERAERGDERGARGEWGERGDERGERGAGRGAQCSERVERNDERGSARVAERVDELCAAAGCATSGESPRGFIVETSRGNFACTSLVVATGGLSVPALGVSDFGYRLARQFGLSIVEPRAALVPFVFGARKLDDFKQLAGVSLEAVVSCGKASFAGALLFTHRGISGPAILQASSYWKPGMEIMIDLLPGAGAASLLEEHRASRQELRNVLAQVLPARFAEAWAADYGGARPLREFANKDLARIVEELHHWRVLPDGTEGYRTAEVTAGGVDTNELSSKTMQVRRVPGLYFIGEVVDVTGQLGGFNFQWAWASGHAAGEVV